MANRLQIQIVGITSSWDETISLTMGYDIFYVSYDWPLRSENFNKGTLK